MNTFILMWNPAVSSYKMEQFEDELIDFPAADYNWSIWEHGEAHENDRFYMIKIGAGRTGVVMSGYFSSEPYVGEDWSGKGHKTYYVDLAPDHIFHPEFAPILTTEALSKMIPDFYWGGGHSGRIIVPIDAEKLEECWSEFLDQVDERLYDEKECIARGRRATVEDCIRFAVDALDGQKDLDGKPAVLHSIEVGLMGRTQEEQIAGFLHDVVEDSDHTFLDLVQKGVDRRVIEALRLLTHDKKEDYYDYIRRLIKSGNDLALTVKRNDLRQNLCRGRLGGHAPQVRKHEKAWAMLKKAYPMMFTDF